MSTATLDLDALSDTIAGLTLKQAKELSDKLKDKHGIEAAAGGAVMMAAPTSDGGGGGAAKAEEKTAFDVILTGFGDKKLGVIKEVRAILPGLSLPDAKNLVEKVPGKIKEGVSKEEAATIKKKLEEAGGTVEIK
jgi:large subunit ribosomal protein L7/L12